MVNVAVWVLLVFAGFYVLRAARSFLDSLQTDREPVATAPTEPVKPADLRRHGRPEPAYTFDGVPDGWSLDRYARDGVHQLQVLLAQHARRADPQDETPQD